MGGGSQGRSSSWPSRWWKSVSGVLGDIWQSSDAPEAFETKQLKSNSAGGPSLRLALRNATPIPLIICWISEEGKPHHFYTLDPFVQKDGSLVTAEDRIEYTSVGHAFSFAAHCDEKDIQNEHLDPSTVIGGYRPLRLSLLDEGDDTSVHIVTITEKVERSLLCIPMLRGRKHHLNDNDGVTYSVSVKEGTFDSTPLDTSDKHYEHATLGGWPVRLERNWHGGDKELEKKLERDLQYVCDHLPEHARTFLQKCTPIYINRLQKYGPAACPVRGRGMCFHPGEDWLVDNGMSKDKCECVELYEAAKYKDDSSYWGPGGVLLHELSHAYHWKMCKGGYENKEIKECWRKAMKDGLYDKVRVHGSQGPTARAYACTDQMEYFAELSAAFLGGLDPKEEYNKWFPFCREQIKEHDPRAYKMLQRMWKVNCDSPK